MVIHLFYSFPTLPGNALTAPCYYRMLILCSLVAGGSIEQPCPAASLFDGLVFTNEHRDRTLADLGSKEANPVAIAALLDQRGSFVARQRSHLGSPSLLLRNNPRHYWPRRLVSRRNPIEGMPFGVRDTDFRHSASHEAPRVKVAPAIALDN